MSNIKIKSEYALIGALIISALPIYNISYYDLFAHTIVVVSLTFALIKYSSKKLVAVICVMWIILAWEFFEYYYNMLIGVRFLIGYEDTLFDILAGILGLTAVVLYTQRE